MACVVVFFFGSTEVVERISPPAPVEILPTNAGQDIAPTQAAGRAETFFTLSLQTSFVLLCVFSVFSFSSHQLFVIV